MSTHDRRLALRCRARCIALGLVLAAFTPAAAEAAGGSFEQEFANPSAEVRPKTDWYMPDTLSDLSSDVLQRQIGEIAEAGLSGADIFNVEMSLTADSNDLLERALVAARDAGIRLDLTMGAAFPPVGVPTTVAGSGVEAQELIYGNAVVAAGDTFDGPVPEPVAEPERPRSLVAVVAARCAASCTGEPPVILERDSLTDLTEETGANAEVTWTAPGESGEWILFAFWRRSTATPYSDYFSAGGARAVTKYWDEHALTPEIKQLLEVAGGEIREDSLHLEAFGLWTRDFLSEFQRRRGYSLRRYLPVTVIPYLNDWVTQNFIGGWRLSPDSQPDYEFSGDTGARIRNDYYQTLSELYEEHHLRPLTRWARSHGLEFRAKPAYGQSFDISSATSVGVPNTESFQHGNRIDANRAIAGPVHLGRQNVLAVECCPISRQVGYDAYSSTWQHTLAVLNATYAVGTNDVLLHGMGYAESPGSPWPGAYWPFIGQVIPPIGPLGLAESYGPWMPYWAHMPDITAFIGREQLVLRQGQPKVDVAVYRHSYWSQNFPHLTSHRRQDDWLKDKTLERSGYSYDFVGPALFDLPNATIADGRLDPGGPAYKALVLDTPQQEHVVDGMPLAAAERILEYARAGLPVLIVGETPDRTGFFGDSADDPAVKRTIARLLAEPTVRQVGSEAEIAGALTGLGIRPDFAPAEQSSVLSAHRASGNVDFYFLYNQDNVDAITGEPRPTPAPFDEKVSFVGRGQPYALDPWTGETAKLGTWKQARDRVQTEVSLAPGESTIIAVGPRGWERGESRRPRLHAHRTTADQVIPENGKKLWVRASKRGRYTTKLSNGNRVKTRVRRVAEPVALSSWHLSVEDWQPGASPDETVKVPRELDLQALRSWPEIPDLEDASGIGRYRTEVELGRRWIAKARKRQRRGVIMELGPIFDSVRVIINGRRLPPIDRYNATADVTSYLRRGTNTIEVEIATTLRNRLRALPEYPEYAEAPRQPYGLAGPVRLVPYGEAAIRTRGDRR